MSELIIQYHDFETAKEELKKFSEQTATDLDLKKVDDSKGVSEFLGDWFFGRGIGLDHKVTGEELNELTTQIQTHLHSINNTQISLIREFGQVYSALEALDKDYIQAILVSIKATEKTSDSIQQTQGEINKIVENQRKTLEELKKFKQKLDGYAHLGDIDIIWNDCQRWYNEINALSKSIEGASQSSKESAKKADAMKIALTAAEKKIKDLSMQSSVLIEKLETIIVFTNAVEQVTHLKDVDEMWESLASAHNSIRDISGEFDLIQNAVSKKQEDLNILLTFMEKLSGLKHLMDVDDIWEQKEDYQFRIKELEKTGKTHMSKLEELVQTDDRILERVNLNEGYINCLKKYKEKLSNVSHLEDVDSIWKEVEGHTSQLTVLEKQNEGIVTTIQKNKEDVDTKIADAIQETNTAVESLKKRIKYVYLIAGSSVGLAIIELILLFIRVIQ